MMKKLSTFRNFAIFCVLGTPCIYPAAVRGQQLLKPVSLECDSLPSPLGVDTKQPLLSWKLEDPRVGARQSAYEILVASTPASLGKGKADVWDSGRVTSDRSIDVRYAGPAPAPEKRYYWRVRVWDKDGKPYPLSDVTWWEMGLMDSSNWHAQWIGYEDTQHRSVRDAHAIWVTNPAVQSYRGDGNTQHDFRLAFDLPNSVKRAVLYVTGEDTATAWINGKQVVVAKQRPPWGRLPWRTYAQQEITPELHAGKNVLAIAITTFEGKNRSQTPMSSLLYIEMMDGTVKVLKTGDAGWKAAFNVQGDWYTPQYSDASWQEPVPYAAEKDPFGGQDQIGSPLPTDPVAALRRSFQVEKPIASARLYATALGAYKFNLNGKEVGSQILSPGWTDFRQRVTYQVFDVTSLLRPGSNAIGAYLASGWYATPLEWIGQGNNYGATPPALKAQLRIEHTDGSVDWIATDTSWKAAASPITFAEIYDGETYDARLLQPGWSAASFSDANWKTVDIVHPHEPEIVWQSFQPIRVDQVIAAKTVTQPKPGVYIYDFGQNLAGFATIAVQGKTGTDVRLRFGELINADGTLYVDNLRNAKATDHYILAGKGIEHYQPTFTFHGFRYVEVSGVPAELPLSAIKAVVIHTNAPMTAQLKTGSPMLNQLWSNILWGQRSNFVGLPTDCPQRDERLGWSADAQVFWRTASFNMDLAAFSRKYATDLRGTQTGTAMYGIYAPGTSKPNPGYGTGWSDAGIIIPWTSWIQTGDDSIVEQNWDGMQKYMSVIEAANPDNLWRKKYGTAFGDWLSPEGSTPIELIATAYWAYDASLMEQMANAIGKKDEAQKYADLFEKIRTAFDHSFVHENGTVSAVPSQINSTAEAKPVETQTGYVLALHMNLLPDSLRPLAAQRLVDRIAANNWRLGTGFLGTPYLLEVLTDTGHADVAYRLLLNTQYPSWGYMVEHGATTMWERWNGDQMRGDPGMNSYNHYAYGAVAEWIYRYAAGIDELSSDAGFHTILLHPNFDPRLGSLDFSYESPYGTIKSAWTIHGDAVTWKVTVPPNTSARLPLSVAQAKAYTLNGQAISGSPLARTISKQGGRTIYELQAGTYSFSIRTM